MKLEYQTSNRDSKDKKSDKKPQKRGRFRRTVSAVAAAVMLYFSPMTENIAKAQDKPPKDNGRRVLDFSDEWEEIEAGEPAEKPPAEEKKPEPPAEEKAPEKPPEAAEENKATIDATAEEEVDISAQTEQKVFYHNFSLDPQSKARSEYEDPALSASPNLVDVSGKRRKVNLDNNWDLGGNILGNEAGTSVFGSVRFRDLARFDGGEMSYYGQHMMPFARLYVRPEVNLWRFKAAYYGSLATAGNLPSWLYTSHSVGLGYSQPIPLDRNKDYRKFRIRLGTVGGGALSYPAFDDLYYNLAAGMSLQLAGYPDGRFDYLIYGMPAFYAAASDPMKTSYIMYYKPRFQNVEFGAQARIFDDYTLRAFADILGPYNRYGLRGTWTVDISDSVEGDLWAAGGVTHWDKLLGNRVDPMVMVGARIVWGGKSINSTNTSRYEHLQRGGVTFAETHFPDSEHPGPYGFGRSGDPSWDVPVKQAKQRITNASSFGAFKSSYRNASDDDKIMAARFLGAFMVQVAYANDAKDALYDADMFNPEVKKIAAATNETIFNYVQQYVDWYSSHGPNAEMPAHLKSGIAMCGGIHWIMADFLDSNGIPTVVATVNTPKGPHFVAISQTSDRTMLFDYGSLYETGPDAVDETLRFYGRNNGAPTFQSQIFGPGGGYKYTIVTSEGRLLHQTMGIVNEEVLKRDFLGVK